MDRLQQIVQRLARPIEFAGRDAGAHLAAVKNLGPFISRQVIEALADDVYPPGIETDLLSLRQLFRDFDDDLEADERKRRLAGARAILGRLNEAGRQGGVPSPVDMPSPPASRPIPPADLWNIPIQFAKGVGPKRAVLLEKLGVRTVEDALWRIPWRYEDRSIVTPLAELSPGMDVTVCGRVVNALLKRTAHRRMNILKTTVEDQTGTLQAVFFNQPFLEKLFQPGARIMLNGRITTGPKGWTDLQMESPHYEVLGEADEAPLHVGRIVPVYHETKGLTSRHMRVMVRSLLDHYGGGVEDVLPEVMRARQRLPHLEAAFRDIHFPAAKTNGDALDRGVTSAHRRLAFEELFVLEVALALRHRSVKEEVKGIRFTLTPALLARLRQHLPFRLTPAQGRVLSEIQSDMAAPRPMNRLLQGDVGCGKTIVALHAMLIACGSGYQAALMVPTEILAEQHYLTIRGLIGKLGLKTVLLKGGGSAKQRKDVLRQIASAEADVVIGTHAVIQKGVLFAKLGLAVIDEQHKFGVMQRKTLLEKGYHPDVLVLTATPIPRTLAMTVYGDLDVSVIDAMPPGRTPVRTWIVSQSQRRRAYQVLQDEVRAGHQGYIVYPLVDESEKIDLQAAMQAAERLQANEFTSCRVGLLHGRMKADEKERVMAAFKAGEIQILVTTTVIEVGVDVPNATVMLIEHAERFGLAQLHQLRGRVGRGAAQSYCLLITSAGADHAVPSSLARRRLEALVKSSDGFVIAEEDLRIRGPGDFFGIRQWGDPEFRVANLVRDLTVLEQARREAFALIKTDPHLTASAHGRLRETVLRRWKAKLDLGSVS